MLFPLVNSKKKEFTNTEDVNIHTENLPDEYEISYKFTVKSF